MVNVVNVKLRLIYNNNFLYNYLMTTKTLYAINVKLFIYLICEELKDVREDL